VSSSKEKKADPPVEDNLLFISREGEDEDSEMFYLSEDTQQNGEILSLFSSAKDTQEVNAGNRKPGNVEPNVGIASANPGKAPVNNKVQSSGVTSVIDSILSSMSSLQRAAYLAMKDPEDPPKEEDEDDFGTMTYDSEFFGDDYEKSKPAYMESYFDQSQHPVLVEQDNPIPSYQYSFKYSSDTAGVDIPDYESTDRHLRRRKVTTMKHMDLRDDI
jgi:hypothetical protein